MAKFTVAEGQLLKHNGQYYKAGDVVEMSAEEARATNGSVVIAEKVEAPKGDSKPATDDSEQKENNQVTGNGLGTDGDKNDEGGTGEGDEPNMDWTRSQLEDYAETVGVKEPHKMANKAEILEAITKARA